LMDSDGWPAILGIGCAMGATGDGVQGMAGATRWSHGPLPVGKSPGTESLGYNVDEGRGVEHGR